MRTFTKPNQVLALFTVLSLLFHTNLMAQTCTPTNITSSTSLVEGFDNTTLNTCWSTNVVASPGSTAPALTYVATASFPTVSAPYSGTDFVHFNSFNCQNGSQIRLVSPQLNTTAVTSVDVNFAWYNENNPSYSTGNGLLEGVTVQYSLDSGVTWTTAQFFSRHDGALASGTGQWELKNVTLPVGAAGVNSVLVGFLFNSGYGDNCNLDQVTVRSTPSCATPTLVTTSGVTSTSANVAFTCTNCNPGTNYIVEYGLSGFTPGVDANPGTGGTVVTTTTLTAALSGLLSGSNYDVYVRQDCGSGNYSGNSSVSSFTTACAIFTITPTISLVEGFNTPTLNPCWSTTAYSNGSFTAPALTYVNSASNPTVNAPYEGANFIHFNSYNVTSGGQIRLVSPTLNTVATTSIDVEFAWYAENSPSYNSGNFLLEGVTVQYSTDGGTTWVNGTFYPRQDNALALGTGAWEYKTLTLPAAVAGDTSVLIGFLFNSEFGDNCNFDKVTIKQSPSCLSPSAVAVTGITTTNAIVNFACTNCNPGTNYVIEYGPTGFTPGVDTTAGGGTVVQVTSLIDTLTGLSSSTAYDVYVRQNCGAGSFSSNSQSVSFNTLCTSFNITSVASLVEGFNGATLNSCWSTTVVNNASFTTPAIDLVSSNSYAPTVSAPFEGAGFVRFNSYNCGNSSTLRLVSQAVNTTAVTSVDVEFAWYAENSTYYNNGVYLQEGVTLQYSIDGGTTWNDVQFFPRNDATLPSGSGAWKYKITTLPAAAAGQANVLVGFLFDGEYGDYCNMDKVTIKKSPDCIAPSVPTVVGVTDTAATINFGCTNCNPNNNFIIEYGPTGFTPGTDSTAGVGGTVIITSSSPVTITGLTQSTGYDVYVRQSCTSVGSGYSSNCPAPASFITACAPFVVTALTPFQEGFDSYTLNNCWSTVTLSNTGFTAPAITFQNSTYYGPAISAPYQGANFGQFNSSYVGYGDQLRLVSRLLNTNAINSVDVEFAWYAENSTYYGSGVYSQEGAMVQYSTDGGATWNDVQFFKRNDSTLAVGTGQWNYEIVTLPDAAAHQPNLLVGLLFTGYGGDNCSFDTLTVKKSPDCIAPSQVAISGVSDTSANVTFVCTNCAPANNYIVEYGITGFTPGTDSTAGVGGTIVHTTSLTTTLNGLAPNTNYTVYVRQNCSANSFGYSNNSTGATFNTKCVAFIISPVDSLVEGFNTPTLNNCWSKQVGTYSSFSTPAINFVSNGYGPTINAPFEGASYLQFNSYSLYGGGELRLISPILNTTAASSVDVDFAWYAENSSYYNTGNYLLEGATLQYSLDNGTTWQTVQFIRRQDISLASGTGAWIQKTITLPTVCAGQPNLLLSFKFHGEGGDYCNMDLVIVKQTPHFCQVVNNVAVTNVTDSAATVSFGCTACLPGNNYIVEYGAGGFIPGTIGGAGTGGTIIHATSSPVTISGLTPNTLYTVYVRQNCTADSSGYSSNSAVDTFSTLTHCTGFAISPSGTVTVCGSSSTPLDAGAGYTHYIWSNGDTTRTINVTSAGTYKVTVTSSTCIGTAGDSVAVGAAVIPTVNASPSAFGICANVPVTFTAHVANSGNAPVYQWFRNGVSVGGNTATYTDSSLQNGDQVNVVMISSATCASPDTVTSTNVSVRVGIKPDTTVVLSGATTFCTGDSITITAPAATSFIWSTGDTSRTITVKNTGSYIVTATNNSACSTIVPPVTITERPVPTLPIISQTSDTLTVAALPGFTYQWYKSTDTLIPGATGQIYVVPQNGYYSLEATDSNGCKVHTNAAFINITGISNLVDSHLWKVYPNPTTGEVNLEINGLTTDKNVVIRVYDYLGKINLERTSIPVNNSLSLHLNLNNLAEGIYLIQATQGDWMNSQQVIITH